MDIPPQQESGRPCRAPMDEEAASAPYTLPPYAEPQVQPEFQVPPMP